MSAAQDAARQIRERLAGKVDFSLPRFVEYSNGAKDFIKCLLEKQASKRPNAHEALSHPWLEQPLVLQISKTSTQAPTAQVDEVGGF